MTDNTTSPEPGTDTLPEWLHQRFGAYLHGGDNQPWDHLPDDDRAYWAHEAAAVQRAVARGGFKDRTVQAEHDAQVRAAALREGDQLAAGLGRSAATYARRYEKAADRLRATRQTLTRYRSTLAAIRTAVTDAKACNGVDCTVDHRDVVLGLIDDGAPEVLPLAVAIEQRDGWNRQAQDADRARAREVDAHSEHRRALCDALGRHTGLDWATIIQRVQGVAEDAAGHARAARQHEEHRRQLADVLGEAPRRDWEYLIRSAGASRAEAAQRATKLAEARQLAGARRKAFADALGADQLRDWDDLLNAARGIAKDRRAQQRRAESAESASRADGRRADRAEEEAREARQGETDAVRGRKTAEARTRSVAADLLGAEAEVARLGLMVDEYSEGARGISEKLRRAKATLARARDAVTDATKCRAITISEPWATCSVDHLAAIEAALDPQPTEPECAGCAGCGGPDCIMRAAEPCPCPANPFTECVCPPSCHVCHPETAAVVRDAWAAGPPQRTLADALNEGTVIMQTAIREYMNTVAPAVTAAARALGLIEDDQR